WPPEADGPVFDLLHGDVHVARVWKDSDNWRLVLRQTHEMTRSLAYLLQTLAILADRMKAVENEEGRRSGLSAQSAGGEPVLGADAIRRLLDALQTPGEEADRVSWGDSDPDPKAVEASAKPTAEKVPATAK
ncbi:MAG: hypothetical protein MI723_05530, partial [Caulobacterales bacterium]|nr:hypothetical protein [Caulobacterales bacterium]